MLFATPDLTADDQRVLAEIDGYYADFRRATGGAAIREWVGGVRKLLLASAIMGSNTIEGYSVELGTAEAIVEGASVPADVPEESREAVTGYRDAMNWVLQMPELDFFTHSEMVLSALHFMMMRFWKGKWPGRYRKGGIVVTGAGPLTPAYVGPAPDDVPALMGALVDWLNEPDPDTHQLVRAAMAHLMLVSIHPWRDGNGRMARCLQTLVIARAGWTYPEFCSIEEWLGYEINTRDYYHALRETRGSYQPERDTHAWVRFCLRAHHQQAQVVDRRLRLGAALWARVEALVDGHGLNPRVVPALYAAALGQLRRETYMAEEGVTRDQAVRDIRRLERAGLLAPVNYGATLHYVAAGELKDIVDEETAAVTSPAREPYRT
jgi:Fic family protein